MAKKTTIPAGLTTRHVNQALAELDANPAHPFGEPTKYVLIHDGKHYAPKAVVGFAHKAMTGEILPPERFNGGEAPGCANYVLRNLGFTVREKEQPCPFVVGEKYSRADIYRIMQVPEDRQKGNWETGYNRWGNDLFIFPAVGGPATGGFDYPNKWENDGVLIWYTKENTTVDQPQVQWMLNEAERVFVFTRPGVRNDFTFHGLGSVESSEPTSPVKIRWRIRHPESSRKPARDAYLLTWNPDKWHWVDLEAAIARCNTGGAHQSRWSTGNTQKITAGDRLFLFKQGAEPRGLMASGYAKSAVFNEPHWDGSGALANYVRVAFDRILPPGEVIPVERLLEQVPNVVWNNLYASGISIPEGAIDAVTKLWEQELVDRNYAADALPEELPADERYLEGAVKTVTVNAFERNHRAKEACKAHFGTRCIACKFDFGEHYGEIGEGFIHIHHLRSITEIGEEYEIDPRVDLRPVCPNCHAMLHTSRPALTIEQLIAIMEDQKNRKPS